MEHTVSASTICLLCGKDLPEISITCRICNDIMVRNISPELAKECLNRISSELNKHVNNPAAVIEDENLKGGFSSTKITILATILTVLSFTALIFLLQPDTSAETSGIICIIWSIFTAIILIIVLVNDYRAVHIQDAANPEKAFRRFFDAIRSGRFEKSFSSLAPTARVRGAVPAADLGKSKNTAGGYSISNPDSFRQYWESIFAGAPGQTRTVKLNRITRICETGTDEVLIGAEFIYTFFPAWMAIFALIPIHLIDIIIITLVKSGNRNVKIIKKLMLKRNGKWYIADGEFEGLHDRLAVMALEMNNKSF